MSLFLNLDLTDRREVIQLRKQRMFNHSVFNMKAVGESLLQLHWLFIYMGAFLIIHQGVCVCLCLGHGACKS